VVIGKLRSENSESHHQHLKAAKALLIIIPLLGITYLITLMPPTHQTGYLIFQHLRAVLLSTQVLVM
jgi:corticotropin releasing hormone receptor 1